MGTYQSKKSLKKIKIAFVIDQLGTGGTERQLKLLAEGLDRNRFEPSLYLLRGEVNHPMKPDNVPCHVLGIHSLGNRDGLRKIWRFSRMLRRTGCHIVQTFFQDAAFCGALAGRLAGVNRILVSVRDMLFWADAASIRPLQFAIRLSHVVVVNSVAVREKILPLSGKKPVQVIYNGIETGNGYAKNRESKKLLAAEMGFDADVPSIVMVSNCNRQVKRVDLLVESAPLVLMKKEAVFLIVGDGYLRPALEKRVAELGVEKNVLFLGQRDDVAAILAGSDIFVNASDSEGFSNSIMEAMRAGLPVVASSVSGNKDWIRPYENGLLFKAGDPVELSLRILYLIRNPSLRVSVSNNGKRYVKSYHSIDIIQRNYKDFYQRVI